MSGAALAGPPTAEGSWVARHKRSILAIMLAFAVAGGFSAVLLPTGLFLVVQFPRVVINVDSGARPADQTALLVTIPLEQAVRRVQGAQGVRSTTSRGSVEVSLDFAWGTDMVAASVQVDAAVAQVLPSLPSGTTYQIRRMDPTVFPIIAYSLMSKTLNSVQQRDIAQYQIVPLLTAIPGVAYVGVQGGDIAAVQILIDPHRLAARGLALSDVTTALGKGNVLQVVGRMQDHAKLLLLAVDNRTRQIEQLRDTIVSSAKGSIVRIGDVANVSAGVMPQWTRVSEDGRPAVQFQVYQQPNANTVSIAAAVHQALATFQTSLPPGVTLTNWYDQSVLVTQSAGSVRDAILIGLVLAAVVLYAFLRSCG